MLDACHPILHFHTGYLKRVTSKTRIRKFALLFVSHFVSSSLNNVIVQSCPHIHWFSVRGLPRPKKKLKNQRNKRFVSFKTSAKRKRAVTCWNPQPKRSQYLTHLLLSPYSRFSASILLLAFSLFALVAAALSQCLCSESPYLSIKLYCIYVCYTNITLCIAFGIICGFT
jgi:hypothetical protein